MQFALLTTRSVLLTSFYSGFGFARSSTGRVASQSGRLVITLFLFFPIVQNGSISSLCCVNKIKLSQWTICSGQIGGFQRRSLIKHLTSCLTGSVTCANFGSSPLWSSGQSSWLQIQRSWVRFPALPVFLRSSGSGTGPTQPREDN
jgi:hypothetical protein